MTTQAAYWQGVNGEAVFQGDWLPGCRIPVFQIKSGTTDLDDTVKLDKSDLIVVTQSCDLEQGKVHLVALCPIYSLPEFEAINEAFKKAGRWEEVRKGRFEGLHMLASPSDPSNNREALVVDFRMIFSLPIDYVRGHAANLGQRWRLDSPFLEHFSQAFARFFMRVGLPSAIPPFK
ncbi:MAG: hypothetical protein K1X67_23790 [Fimbriimonadaceae bacterium]|nr:hypothetical protein [Fimbriimonadaceae bacterium]